VDVLGIVRVIAGPRFGSGSSDDEATYCHACLVLYPTLLVDFCFLEAELQEMKRGSIW